MLPLLANWDSALRSAMTSAASNRERPSKLSPTQSRSVKTQGQGNIDEHNQEHGRKRDTGESYEEGNDRNKGKARQDFKTKEEMPDMTTQCKVRNKYMNLNFFFLCNIWLNYKYVNTKKLYFINTAFFEFYSILFSPNPPAAPQTQWKKHTRALLHKRKGVCSAHKYMPTVIRPWAVSDAFQSGPIASFTLPSFLAVCRPSFSLPEMDPHRKKEKKNARHFAERLQFGAPRQPCTHFLEVI